MPRLAGARFLTNEKRLLIAVRFVVTLVLLAFFVGRPAHFETPWQFWLALGLPGGSEAARRLGFAGYLRKPIQPSELMDGLATAWTTHASGKTAFIARRLTGSGQWPKPRTACSCWRTRKGGRRDDESVGCRRRCDHPSGPDGPVAEVGL